MSIQWFVNYNRFAKGCQVISKWCVFSGSFINTCPNMVWTQGNFNQRCNISFHVFILLFVKLGVCPNGANQCSQKLYAGTDIWWHNKMIGISWKPKANLAIFDGPNWHLEIYCLHGTPERCFTQDLASVHVFCSRCSHKQTHIPYQTRALNRIIPARGRQHLYSSERARQPC